jgi:hypothetical protein
VDTTDYRFKEVSKGVRVGTGEYFEWIEGFSTLKKKKKTN